MPIKQKIINHSSKVKLDINHIFLKKKQYSEKGGIAVHLGIDWLLAWLGSPAWLLCVARRRRLLLWLPGRQRSRGRGARRRCLVAWAPRCGVGASVVGYVVSLWLACWAGRILRAGEATQKSHAGKPSVPVLLDVNVPLPLEMLVLVVVRKEGANVVGSPLQQAGGGVLHGGQVGVLGLLGSVGAHHVSHLINGDARPGTRLAY